MEISHTTDIITSFKKDGNNIQLHHEIDIDCKEELIKRIIKKANPIPCFTPQDRKHLSED